MPNTNFSTIKKYCVVTGRGEGEGGEGAGRKGGWEGEGEVEEGGDGEICNSVNNKKKKNICKK